MFFLGSVVCLLFLGSVECCGFGGLVSCGVWERGVLWCLGVWCVFWF